MPGVGRTADSLVHSSCSDRVAAFGAESGIRVLLHKTSLQSERGSQVDHPEALLCIGRSVFNLTSYKIELCM